MIIIPPVQMGDSVLYRGRLWFPLLPLHYRDGGTVLIAHTRNRDGGYNQAVFFDVIYDDDLFNIERCAAISNIVGKPNIYMLDTVGDWWRVVRIWDSKIDWAHVANMPNVGMFLREDP